VLGLDDWIAIAVAVASVVASALGIVAPPAVLAFCDGHPPPLHSRPPIVVVVIVVIISPQLGDDYDIVTMCLPPRPPPPPPSSILGVFPLSSSSFATLGPSSASIKDGRLLFEEGEGERRGEGEGEDREEQFPSSLHATMLQFRLDIIAAMIIQGVVHNTGFFAMYNHNVSTVTMLLEEGLTPRIIVNPSPSSSNVRKISLPPLAFNAFVRGDNDKTNY
jgi:hypothetical protein